MNDGSAGGAGQRYEGDASPFQRPARRPLLQRLIPVSEEVPGYRGGTLRRDLQAGVTVAALALPASLAYAEIAGLSPVIGLYALLLPAIAYALLGSSRQLVVGPDGSVAALVGAAVIPMTVDPEQRASLAAMLALLVGGVFLGARLVRLGWIADYLSRPVLIGYIHGVAAVLIIGQLGKLLGLNISAESPPGELLEVIREIDEINWATFMVGVTCLVVLLLFGWLFPKLPAPLVVVVLAIVVSAVVGLANEGVAVVGHIPAGLPGLEVPDVGLLDTLKLIPAALGIFFVGFSGGILTARTYAGRHGQHVHAGAELAAMGAANLAAGISQAFPVGASGSRTSVNDQMGARTQLSGLLSAGVTALVLLFFTGPVEYLPVATLGAVIVAAALGMIDVAAWRGLARISRVEVAIAAITVVGVISVGVLRALLLAIALSVVDAVRRSATPHDAVLGWVERLNRYADVRLHPSAKVVPGVLVYRLDDRLFFANAHYVKGRIREAVAGAPARVHWLVFDAEALNHVDATGVRTLTELIESLREESITFVFARLHGFMSEHLDEAGIVDLVGEDHLYPTVRAAVQDAPSQDRSDNSSS
ncbi:MAG TPA: SulP family inorganic anion transporter [Propionibacteriaceae bacterium]|nr:SulP family inorganic anion transporter [Propionibacteriaceae bacterium]